jgi:uncharacterized membrane protein
MSNDLILFACGATALISGIVSGVFLTFSDFGMRSLVATTPETGIQSMQLINRKVYKSLFIYLLLGLAPVYAALAVYGITVVQPPASGWLISGGLVYIFGVFLVTMLYNVPMNKRLDVIDGAQRVSNAYWRHYATVWTRWNHLRTLAAAVSAICYFIACMALVGA